MTEAATGLPVLARHRGRDLGPVTLGLLAIPVLLFVLGIGEAVVESADATATMLPGWSTAVVERHLLVWGLPVDSVVALLTVLELLTAGSGIFVAFLLLRAPRSGFRCYVAAVLVLHTVAGGTAPALSAEAIPALTIPAAVLNALGWFGLFTLLAVFPDGRFVPRWTRWAVPGWIALFLYFLLFVDADAGPPVLPMAALLILLVIGAGSQLHRYRRVSDDTTRRQTRWVLAALVARVAVLLVAGILRLTGLTGERSADALAVDLVSYVLSYLISILLALTVAVAVLRHRLLGSEVVVRRAVVAGALGVAVLAAYGLTVGILGLLWRGGGVIVPVLATAATAAIVAPMRSWLQRHVIRLVYGDRAEPYRILGDLNDRLAATTDPEDLLQAVVDAVGRATGAYRVGITIEGDDVPVAAYAALRSATAAEELETESFAVDHLGQRIGSIKVAAPRSDPMTLADRRLVGVLAGHAGLALAIVGAAAEVRAARDEAVAARESERRRLHRDLHDGLGPTLASIYQRIEFAGRLVDTDPAASRRLLDDTGEQVRSTVAEVRRLVHALRPPQLDALGLEGAIRAYAAEISSPQALSVEVGCPVPLPLLPAAVEVTAYRIALEAVTNTVRHSGAAHCRIELTPAEGGLRVGVTDDGVGLPDRHQVGAGLRSLHERATEVGGRLDIRTAPGGGTTVEAWLPLAGASR